MEIFFTGSIRGGRSDQPKYSEIIKILEKYGQVKSAHVADESISEHGETELSKTEIYNREINSLKESDLVVAEVTTPSLGVGYLISYASNLGKRVIALYNGKDDLKLSAIIKGDKNTKTYTYQNISDLKEILESELGG